MTGTLREYDWQSIYESQPSEDISHLIDEFYVPALKRSTQYDRIAGYFNSGSLAAAANGIEAFVENDGTMRLIVGAQLQPKGSPLFLRQSRMISRKSLEDLRRKSSTIASNYSLGCFARVGLKSKSLCQNRATGVSSIPRSVSSMTVMM